MLPAETCNSGTAICCISVFCSNLGWTSVDVSSFISGVGLVPIESEHIEFHSDCICKKKH